MRKKPLKEKCSYYFNQTVVFYEMDPGNTVNRGSCPSWSRLLMKKAEKSTVHSRAFFTIFYHLQSGVSVLQKSFSWWLRVLD